VSRGLKEPLINSESFSCVGKMRQIKAPIAGNSKAIAKIDNAELAYFNKQMLIHEFIRGSLGNPNAAGIRWWHNVHRVRNDPRGKLMSRR
jgi:hypothetical protein